MKIVVCDEFPRKGIVSTVEEGVVYRHAVEIDAIMFVSRQLVEVMQEYFHYTNVTVLDCNDPRYTLEMVTKGQ